MKEKFLDFLSKNTRVQLNHPIFFNSHNIIAFLISNPDLAGNNISIITDVSDKINQSLGNPLPSEFYISYSSLAPQVGSMSDLRSLSDLFIPDSIVIFDNSSGYSEIPELNECKIICLNDDPLVKLDGFTSIKLNLYNQGPILNYQLKLSNNKVIEVQKAILSKAGNNHYTYSDSQENNSKNDISYLHLITIPNYQEFNTLLRKIYRKDLISDLIDIFNIIFYVDDTSENEVKKYEEISDLIQQISSLPSTPKISFNLEIGLYIE